MIEVKSCNGMCMPIHAADRVRDLMPHGFGLHENQKGAEKIKAERAEGEGDWMRHGAANERAQIPSRPASLRGSRLGASGERSVPHARY